MPIKIHQIVFTHNITWEYHPSCKVNLLTQTNITRVILHAHQSSWNASTWFTVALVGYQRFNDQSSPHSYLFVPVTNSSLVHLVLQSKSPIESICNLHRKQSRRQHQSEKNIIYVRVQFISSYNYSKFFSNPSK